VTIVVPGATPHNIPVVMLIVATEVALDDHVPPVVASDKVIQEPLHITVGPVIAEIANTRPVRKSASINK
jgi:hypothetical protein